MKITAPQLQQIVPMPFAQSETLCAAINGAAPLYDINTPLRMAAFLSQAAHESQNFQKKTENLNYTPANLILTFKYYARNPRLAARHGRITGKQAADQQAIANTVYADKNRDADRKLGNKEDGDGWLYRGFGHLQATGKDIAIAYAKFKGMDVRELVSLCRTSEAYAVDSAMWVFAKYKSLNDEADKGQIITISKRIAGSEMGLKEREALYSKAKKALIG